MTGGGGRIRAARPETPMVEDVNWSVAAGEYWVVGGNARLGQKRFSGHDGRAGASVARAATGCSGGRCRAWGTSCWPNGCGSGLVFDGGQLFHHLTIEENIALPLRYHRELARGDLENSVRSDAGGDRAVALGGAAARHDGARAGKNGRGWRARWCCGRRCCCWTIR